MEGYNHGSTTSESGGNVGVEARGIIPRAIEQIFGHIQRNASPRMRFLVRASYLQIYNEQVIVVLKLIFVWILSFTVFFLLHVL